MTGAANRFVLRWLYIGHRWIGIVTCLLCVMWFVSGIVMMYVPYPRLTDRERIALSADIDWSQVALSPDAAMREAGIKRFPQQARLSMLRGEPVYRFVDGATRVTVSSRDGRLLDNFDALAALAIVRDARPDAANATVETFARDQWTVAQGFNAHRPLRKVLLGDEAGSELYVSSRTGEIVQDTTRRERFWNWLGSVPHWIYPTILRQDGETWRQIVMWTSGPATIGAIAGVWIGVLRFRAKRRYKGDRMTPYRGWMKWHHVVGLFAGVFVVTWLASGWLSVNPFRWFDRAGPPSPARLQAYAGQDGAVFVGAERMPPGLTSAGAREARFVWVAGHPLVIATDAQMARTVIDARSGQPAVLSQDGLVASARKLVPGADIDAVMLLMEEDAYWYSHHNERRLPVLRVIFADDAATWLHIDPATGEVLGQLSRSGRVYRWLFNAVHDFDLRLLLRNRPSWDVLVIALSLAGLIVSLSGAVIGWRRLFRPRRA